MPFVSLRRKLRQSKQSKVVQLFVRRRWAMADIFISYSKKHEHLTQDLARDLEAEGYTTWWDASLLPDNPFFAQTIRSEIAAARVVIVIWAQHSVTSPWVYAEAKEGSEQGKLIQLCDDELDVRMVPMPFTAGNISPVRQRAKIFGALARRGIKPSASAKTDRPLAREDDPIFITISSPMDAALVLLVDPASGQAFAPIGQRVRPGDTLLLIEVMGSHIPVCADCECWINSIIVKEGQTVSKGDALLRVQRSISFPKERSSWPKELPTGKTTTTTIRAPKTGYITLCRDWIVGDSISAGDKIGLLRVPAYYDEVYAPVFENCEEIDITSPTSGVLSKLQTWLVEEGEVVALVDASLEIVRASVLLGDETAVASVGQLNIKVGTLVRKGELLVRLDVTTNYWDGIYYSKREIVAECDSIIQQVLFEERQQVSPEQMLLVLRRL